MAFHTSSLAKAKEHIERIRNTAAKAKEHAERAMGVGIAAVEIGGTAAVMGYVNERYGKPDKDGDNVYAIASVDADLALGVTGHGLGFFGVLGKYSEHGHNLANGGIAAYGYRQGAKYGRTAAHDAAGTTTQGMHAAAWGRAYTQAPAPAYARRW